MKRHKCVAERCLPVPMQRGPDNVGHARFGLLVWVA